MDLNIKLISFATQIRSKVTSTAIFVTDVSFYRNLYFGNWCLKKLVRLLHRSVRESATSASYWLSSSWWAWTLPLELTPPNLSYLNNSRWVNYCQQKPGSREPREIFSNAKNSKYKCKSKRQFLLD